MKIYSNALLNYAYLEGISSGSTDQYIPSMQAGRISVFNKAAQTYDIYNVAFTEIQNQQGQGFSSAGLLFAYLQKVFSVILPSADQLKHYKIAGEPISALQVLYSPYPNLVGVASSLLREKCMVSSIALTAALTGEEIEVVFEGEIIDSHFQFDAGVQLYLSSSGTVTDLATTGNFYVPLGVSLGKGGILFRPSPIIVM